MVEVEQGEVGPVGDETDDADIFEDEQQDEGEVATTKTSQDGRVV